MPFYSLWGGKDKQKAKAEILDKKTNGPARLSGVWSRVYSSRYILLAKQTYQPLRHDPIPAMAAGGPSVQQYGVPQQPLGGHSERSRLVLKSLLADLLDQLMSYGTPSQRNHSICALYLILIAE